VLLTDLPELLGPGFGMVVTGLVWCCRWRVLLTDLPELLGPGFGMDCNRFSLLLQVEGAAGRSLPELLGPGFGMDCNRFGLVL
jgi:hypothetical protein